MAAVTEIWRFPVKSVGGEAISDALVGPFGIDGDRAWGIVDLDTGFTLTARREPRLLFASARISEGSAVIRLPGGIETDDDATISRWLGRDVALRAAGPSDQGVFEISLADDEQTEWVQWEGGTGSFHDSGNRRLTLVAEASLRSWDRRRFRINVLTDGAEGAERSLHGHQVQIGDCVVYVIKNVDRCVVVTRPQPDGIDRDLEVLRTINGDLGGNLGVGGTIATPGRISVGDPIFAVN